MVTPIGESQADHQEAGQNQTIKRQLLQYQGIVGVFSLYKVRDLKHKIVTIITYYSKLFTENILIPISNHHMLSLRNPHGIDITFIFSIILSISPMKCSSS